MIGHTGSEKLKGRDRMTNIHEVFSFFSHKVLSFTLFHVSFDRICKASSSSAIW